tara:strand:+ start:148 stop:813 length:666 start_codon:yes stop_codon:yes gene_type:complete
MHHLIGKKSKIYFYIILLFLLSSIYNFEIKKIFKNTFLIKNIEYQDNGINIKIDHYLNQNIFNINKKEITTYMNKYPILNSFKIKKIYPDKLKIVLKKTTILAKIYINGELFYVGENENIFTSKNKNIDVPVIKGFVEIDQINSFFKILKKSAFSFQNIEYLVYYPSNRWDIIFKNNNIIKLPISLDDDIIKTAKLLYDDENLKDKVIDLRIKNRIILSNE